MTFIKKGDLKYYCFESYQYDGLLHGIFSRAGGVSPNPWESMNLSTSTGDTRENVIENRRLIFECMGRTVESIYDVWQVHSGNVICTNSPRGLDVAPQKADALVTNNPEVTLFMRFADCVPILLFDPKKRVIAIAHAGWQGTVKHIAARTVTAMVENYGVLAEDICAGIGPSVGPDHYEIGQDVIERVYESFGKDTERLLISNKGSIHLNLWETNKISLERAGVRNIQIANICTACNVQDWFSHRGEKDKNGKTGRFGAILALDKL